MPKLIVTALSLDGQWRKLDPRVIEALKNADLLIAEEQKNALRLLAAAECRDKPVILINEHSTDAERTGAVQRILSANCAVFVSDAGTPCISDPDYRLVDACITEGVEICSVPGASSITAALSVSGFPSDRFVFLGFPPREGPARKQFFDELNKSTTTAVFLERPYALKRTLEDMSAIKREISISIELGGAEERNIRGTVQAIMKQTEGCKAPFAIVVPQK